MSFSFTKNGLSPLVANESGLLSGNASFQSDFEEPLSATSIMLPKYTKHCLFNQGLIRPQYASDRFRPFCTQAERYCTEYSRQQSYVVLPETRWKGCSRA